MSKAKREAKKQAKKQKKQTAKRAMLKNFVDVSNASIFIIIKMTGALVTGAPFKLLNL